MRATRHNGRTGKGGTFLAGHNDRSFDSEKADHIDQDKSYQNIYWDCYQGLNICDEEHNRPVRDYSFEQIELAFYMNEFGDSVNAQNERHIASRHTERIRSVEDIYKDKRTCPEETILQLGTMDDHADPKIFLRIASEMMSEIEEKYGENYKTLDWALHMDEGTPHIHERHVFVADDGYGNHFPKQEKALEAMGIQLPDPTKKPGKKNNRKMTFDEEVRDLYIKIAEKYGVSIESVPLEGKTHLDKNDYILAKQREEYMSKQAELNELVLKISDIDSLAEEVAETAYEKACETVETLVRDVTIKEDVSIVENFRDEITKPEYGATDQQRGFIRTLLDNVARLLMRKSGELVEKILKGLKNPEVRKKNQEAIASETKMSFKERLARAKERANEHNAQISASMRDRTEINHFREDR